MAMLIGQNGIATSNIRKENPGKHTVVSRTRAYVHSSDVEQSPAPKRIIIMRETLYIYRTTPTLQKIRNVVLKERAVAHASNFEKLQYRKRI